jgi:hypothetical protein
MVVYRSTTAPAVTDDEMRGLMSRAMQQYSCTPRTLYVSATGDDSNDGLTDSTPVQTIGEALGRYRPAIGEQIRVKFGDTFASIGSTNAGDTPGMLEGQSWDDRAVMCGYGDRADGRYDFGVNEFESSEYSTIAGAAFSNPTGNHLSPSFDRSATEASPVSSPLSWAGSSGTEDVVMVDIWIEGRTSGIVVEAGSTGQSWFEVYRTQMEGIWAQGTGNRPQGIFAGSGTGGMCHWEDVSMSQPGHVDDGTRTIYDHGFYTYNYATTTDDCIVWDASAHGIMSRSVGITQGCLVMQCPVGITGGHGGQIVYNNVCIGGSNQTPTGANRQIWVGSGTYNRVVDNLVIAEPSILGTAVAMNLASKSYADNQGNFTLDSDWEVIVENNTIRGAFPVRFDPERTDEIGTLSFVRNVLDCGASELIQSDDDLSLIPSLSIDHNLYVSTDSTPFENGGVSMNRATWDTEVSDGSVAVRSSSPTYTDDTRDALTWHSSQKSGDGTYAGLMADAHAAHATGWDSTWGAREIVNWIRGGHLLVGEVSTDFGGGIPGLIFPPVSTTLDPENGESNVAESQVFETILNEEVDAGEGTIELRRLSDDSVVDSISASAVTINVSDRREVTLDGLSALGAGDGVYYIHIPEGAFASRTTGEDFAGITDNSTWRFTIGSASSGPRRVIRSAVGLGVRLAS